MEKMPNIPSTNKTLQLSNFPTHFLSYRQLQGLKCRFRLAEGLWSHFQDSVPTALHMINLSSSHCS